MKAILITSSILILLIAALRPLLRGRIDPRIQYALWLAAALRLLLPGSLFTSAYSALALLERADRGAEIVETIQSKIMDDYCAGMMGKKLEVLVDGFDEEVQQFYGRSYADSPDIDGRVLFDSAFSVEEGQFVPVRITGAQGADLTGNTETME